MVGGVQSYLESNLIPIRDTQRVQIKKYLGYTRTLGKDQ